MYNWITKNTFNVRPELIIVFPLKQRALPLAISQISQCPWLDAFQDQTQLDTIKTAWAEYTYTDHEGVAWVYFCGFKYIQLFILLDNFLDFLLKIILSVYDNVNDKVIVACWSVICCLILSGGVTRLYDTTRPVSQSHSGHSPHLTLASRSSWLCCSLSDMIPRD